MSRVFVLAGGPRDFDDAVALARVEATDKAIFVDAALNVTEIDDDDRLVVSDLARRLRPLIVQDVVTRWQQLAHDRDLRR